MVERLHIEKMEFIHWNDVLRIYEIGIRTNNATFETKAPNWGYWDKAHRQDCRLIAKIEKDIVGWAALSNISSRCVYAGVAEVSIYIDTNYQRQGIGDKLMSVLIKESESNNIWTLQASIFPENIASVMLHQKHGFKILGIREHLGKMDNRWRDVTLLERRSKVIGIE